VIYAGAVEFAFFLARPLDDIIAEVEEQFSLGKKFFLFDNSSESLFVEWIKKIQKVAEHFTDIPNKNFVMITGASNGTDTYKKYCEENNILDPITVLGGNFFEVFFGRHEQGIRHLTKEYQIKIKEKKFLCFNKVHRPHRVYFVVRFLENKLIDQAYYSFQGSNENWINEFMRYHHFDKRTLFLLPKHQKKFPMVLNISNQRHNPVDLIEDDLKYFENSYFSLVNETYFFNDVKYSMAPETVDSIFITEKTAKCLTLRHPFVLACRPHSLKLLRVQGYKTFSPYIDESYDSEEDDFKRLDMIAREVERLCQFTDEQWLEWQSNIKDIVDHNYIAFISQKINVPDDILNMFKSVE